MSNWYFSNLPYNARLIAGIISLTILQCCYMFTSMDGTVRRCVPEALISYATKSIFCEQGTAEFG